MAKPSQVQHRLKAIEQSFGFSAVVHANGLLHLAGIISIDDRAQVLAPDDMPAQINRIYDIMALTLGKFGATMEHVVSEVMYTTDMAQLMEHSHLRRQRYEGYAFPASTAVQIVALAFPGAMLEIQVMAQLDGGEWSPEVAPLASPS